MSRRAEGAGTRRWLWLVGAVAMIALIVADRSGWLLVRRGDDMAVYHATRARVVRVIDGDTIEIALPDAHAKSPVTRLRLWGVDCPETATPHQPAEHLAEEATALTRSLAAGRTVSLHLESHRTRGAFGRVLAHVELPDGSSLNEALLTAGYAVVDDRWPHSHIVRYAQLQRAARRSAVGIWSVPATTAPVNQ